MRPSVADHAIKKLNDKIAVLQQCIAEIEAVREAAPAAEEPKVRKPRKKRGLPASEGL